jgi:hypothetical protein
MDIYLGLVVILCSIVFGLIARSLTYDEKVIYQKRQYFQIFKIVLFLGSLLFLFLDKLIFIFLAALLLMVLVWDYGRLTKRTIRNS